MGSSAACATSPFKRVHEGRERELLTLTDEVLDWIESYRTPAAARLTDPQIAQFAGVSTEGPPLLYRE